MRSLRLVWLIVAACGGSAASHPDAAGDAGAIPDGPTYGETSLSGATGSSEDPALVRTPAAIFAAYFTTLDGDHSQLFVRSSADGLTWQAPVQVTTGTDANLCPGLALDDSGVLHLVWMRRTGGLSGPAHIAHATSIDGVTWTPAPDLTSDSDGTDVWCPSLARRPAGGLALAFARYQGSPSPHFDLRVATSADGTTWSVPTAFGLADPAYSDQLPSLATTGTQLTLVWNRYVFATGMELPYETSTSEVMLSTSTDGLSWAPATPLTANSDYDLFPWLYEDDAQNWYVSWLHAPGALPMSTTVVEQALAAGTAIAPYPLAGYSPRTIYTGVAHRYVRAWVEGSAAHEVVAEPFDAHAS